jgi:hypothetical protein
MKRIDKPLAAITVGEKIGQLAMVAAGSAKSIRGGIVTFDACLA